MLQAGPLGNVSNVRSGGARLTLAGEIVARRVMQCAATELVATLEYLN